MNAIAEDGESSTGSDVRVESALVLVGPSAHNSYTYDYLILHVVAYMHMIDQQIYMKTLRPINIKQSKTPNPNNFFPQKRKKSCSGGI